MNQPTINKLHTRAWDEVKSLEKELKIVHACYTLIFDSMKATDTIVIDKLTLGLLLITLSTAMGDITHPNFPNLIKKEDIL